jgi:hypothetical protein
VRRSLRWTAAALGVAAATAGLPALPAQADVGYLVASTADSGVGTLRNAIIWANGHPGPDPIVFRLPGTGPGVIEPRTDLPVVTDPVVIAGYTEPDAAPATATTPATPTVVINGRNVTNGLVIDTDDSTVSGLVVHSVAGIAGHCGGVGICVTGNRNVVRGNYVGVGNGGAGALANARQGVSVEGDDNVVGGSSPEDRNVISGNLREGVLVEGFGNHVIGNRIGTSADGTAAVANNDDGIHVFGDASRLGQTAEITGNLVSGNDLNGIELDSSAAGCLVQGNLVGTDRTGTKGLANGTGILVESDGNQLGGPDEVSANVVSGNAGNGLTIANVAEYNQVVGNLIGPGPGPTLIGNGGFGIELDSDHLNVIGWADPGGGNAIAGNRDDGIRVNGDDQLIQANLIGFTRWPASAGLAPMPNLGDGISVSADGALIGDVGPDSGNVIGVNFGHGILLEDSANDALVRSNHIGVDTTGAGSLGNRGSGIRVDGTGNTIGGADASANTIAWNAQGGITVSDVGLDNPILGNSVFANIGLGIDLLNPVPLPPAGVTANDAGDADTGANRRQNYPEIASAQTVGGVTTISFTLNSTAGTRFRVELFAAATCDPSGNGEATTYLGSMNVRTPPAANVTGGTTTTGVSTPSGTVVVATATELTTTGAFASTSEFSMCFVVT